MSNKIILGNKYGDPRLQANKDPMPHGLTPQTVEDIASKFESFVPGLASKHGSTSRNFFEDILPQGAELDPRTQKRADWGGGVGYGGGGGLTSGGAMVTPQRPYMPEYESPDRMHYPVHRILANRYWRLFYKLDPVISSCLDLYSMMPWSEFQLSGEGITGEIREAYEEMCKDVELLKILEYMVKEFMVIGECVPHCMFDETKGVWSYIALHNPDQLEVIDAPFIKMDPIIEFIPDDRLRAVLTSNNTLLRRVREQMPPELISRLIARQNIPLSPVNCTFLPRRLHPYDTRGTSVISRMWRILMYEDGVYNACYTKNTKVTMSDGSVKSICDISVDDKVLDRHGYESTVDAVWVEDFPKEIVIVKAQGTIALESTKNHKYPVFALPRTCLCGCGMEMHGGASFAGGHSSGFGEGKYKNVIKWKGQGTNRWQVRVPEWYEPYKQLKAEDVRPGDYLMLPRKFKEIKTNKTIEYARLLGYYLAEGSSKNLSWGRGLNFSLCLDELNTLAFDIARILKKFNTVGHIYQDIKRNGCTVSAHRKSSLSIANMLRADGGEYAEYKKLTKEIMSWPIKLKKELLKGYFAGDGSFRKSKNRVSHTLQIKCSSVSQQLIYQIRQICAHCGIFAAISYVPYSKRKQSDGKKRKDQWVLSIQGPSLDTLWKIVLGKNSPREREGYNEAIPCRTWMDDNFIYVPITSVDIVKYNDCVYNITVSGDHSYQAYGLGTYNSIQTARRQAAPLKAALLGNPQTGWIPSPEHEQRLLQLLAQAEMDPASWLVYHYGIKFELVGVQERVMNISQHNEVIERIKLIALGISKSFMHGEVSYASSYTGLSVFLQRMKAVRNFFVNSWLIPKFFKPIAKINGWIKPRPGELTHRYRIKRSQHELEQENRYIVPKMEWEKQLDHTVNTELVQAMTALEGLGIKFSKTTKYAAVNRKYEEEVLKIKEEQAFERKMVEYIPPEMQPGAAPGGAGGGGGGLLSPPPPMGEPGEGMPGEGAGEMPGGAPGGSMPPAAEGSSDKNSAGGGTGPSGKKDPAKIKTESDIWDHKGKYGNWTASEVTELSSLVREGHTESPLWGDLDGNRFRQAINSGDPMEALDVIEEFLEDKGYPGSDIRELRKILDQEGILRDIASGEIGSMKVNKEKEFNRLSKYLGDGEVVESEMFVGNGSKWSGDISDKIKY